MSRRRRGLVWSAAGVPAARRALVRTLTGEAARLATLPERARAVGLETEAVRLERLSADLERAGGHLRRASLYWVSADMGRVAMDASQDVPELGAQDCPTAEGLLAFEAPLPAWDTAPAGGLALRDRERTDVPHTEPVPVDAVAWARTSDRLEAHLCCLTSRLPLPLTGVPAPVLTPFFDVEMPVPMPLDGSVPAMGPEAVDASPQTTGLAALLSAVWVLMMTPTTATRSQLDGRTGRSASEHTRPGDAVTVIDLRPVRTVTDPTDNDDSTAPRRRLRHRHLVRGHWTHQPYGTGRQLRRLTWISSYIRGPADAPLADVEAVYAWRR